MDNGFMETIHTLDYARIGTSLLPDDTNTEGFLAAFGIAVSGATLIRPDGVIAWRSVAMPCNPTPSLTEAFAQLSFAVKGTYP